MPFSAACGAGFQACPRPCDDRLRFCDAKQYSPTGKVTFARPCDDRLRFCDFPLKKAKLRISPYSRPCDDRLRFCD